MNWNTHPGRLELIIGPMFAGKTFEILRRLSIASKLNIKCLYLNHSLDEREKESKGFSTHNIFGRYIETVKIENIDALQSNKLDSIDINNYELIAIDEGQFFSELKKNVLNWVNIHKKHVIVGGLVLDFQANKFGEIDELIGHANDIVSLKPFCKKCLNKTPRKCIKAIYTERETGKEGQIMVGGEDIYLPVCRDCYMK